MHHFFLLAWKTKKAPVKMDVTHHDHKNWSGIYNMIWPLMPQPIQPVKGMA